MSESFEAVILERFCKGCGLCVEFCPQGKLYLRQRPNREGIQPAAVREEVECTGCLRCAAMCPDAAIEIVRSRQKVGSRQG